MMQKRIKNIDEFCKNPIKAQEKVFNFLISKGRNTAFGQAHHFNVINDYTQFSKITIFLKLSQNYNNIQKLNMQ